MALPIFIRLENTIDAAMSYNAGAQMQYFFFGGVQLLPNQTTPYLQTTNSADGISITDYTVQVMSTCGDILADITESFEVVDYFTDDNGNNQTIWSLTNINFDAGYRLVYLRITTGSEAYIYSNPFYLTAFNSEYTSLWHYKQKEADTMMCIGLNLYYFCQSDKQSLTNYMQVGSGQNYNYSSTVEYLEVWRSQVIDANLFRLVKQLFTCKHRYLNYAFVNLSEAFDTPRPEQSENFAETELLLSRDTGNKYDPFYVAPLPPTPEPTDKQIMLTAVASIDNNTVKYTFNVLGFTPTYLIYQYSIDGETWISATSSPNSPRNIPVPNNTVNNYYYRIWHQGENIYSIILQLPAANIVINNITSPNTSWKPGNVISYDVDFTINNFTAAAGTLIIFEFSVDNVTFGDISQTLVTSITGENVLRFTPPASFQQFVYFRIIYSTLGIFSNTRNFEL